MFTTLLIIVPIMLPWEADAITHDSDSSKLVVTVPKLKASTIDGGNRTASQLSVLSLMATEGCFHAHLSRTSRYRLPSPTPSRQGESIGKRNTEGLTVPSPGALVSFSRVPADRSCRTEGFRCTAGLWPASPRSSQVVPIASIALHLGFSELCESTWVWAIVYPVYLSIKLLLDSICPWLLLNRTLSYDQIV